MVSDQVRLELVVDAVDAARFAPLLCHLAADGVTFTTLLAAQAEHPDWLERFTSLDNATRSEAGDPAVPRTTEAMQERMASLQLEPAACILALRGDHWIGYTLLAPKVSEDRRLQQSWTGVRANYRRRGIATALKVLGIEYARAHGFVRIVTATRAQNTASIALSTRVGFVPATSDGDEAV